MKLNSKLFTLEYNSTPVLHIPLRGKQPHVERNEKSLCSKTRNLLETTLNQTLT